MVFVNHAEKPLSGQKNGWKVGEVGMIKCCGNCTFAHDTIGDDLLWCSKDCRSKDYEMYCDKYSNKDVDTDNIEDWLHEIVKNPKGWRVFYSDSEVKLMAEHALEIFGYN